MEKQMCGGLPVALWEGEGFGATGGDFSLFLQEPALKKGWTLSSFLSVVRS